jgi:hypothetical protein
MMSARNRQARRPDITPAALLDAMRRVGFVQCADPSIDCPRPQALAEWTHPDTGARRYVWWFGDSASGSFGRMIGELDAGRKWCGTNRR